MYIFDHSTNISEQKFHIIILSDNTNLQKQIVIIIYYPI